MSACIHSEMASVTSVTSRSRMQHNEPIMSLLTTFGLLAVIAMMICYALESRSRWYILGFAISCVLASVYGFLQGAWPFGGRSCLVAGRAAALDAISK